MYIEHRDSFPKAITELSLKIGVEVGVRAGGYSIRILRDSNIELLYGIDIKVEYYHQKELDSVIKSYPDRYKFILKDSVEAAKSFEDGYFDFIHIDADHTYNGVRKDLHAWWPKLKSGGMFCGDDYIDYFNPQEGRYEVMRAVEEFFNDKNEIVRLTGLISSKKEDRIEFGKQQGREYTYKNQGRGHNFIQTPNWYCIKL